MHQLSINHRHRNTRTRAAGLLMLGRGISPQVIAEQLGVSGQSVYNWSHMWRDSGVCGLMGGHNGGRPFALSEAMLITAIDAAKAEAMTLRRIAQRVEEVHGVPFPCHLDTLSIALKRAGFSYKRGRYSLKK
ncbi:helix-turn-helix domain-containing protein, partial [Paraburkholderia aspalathi]|uniref:helix-turn-helix domain-containing protein n=1 Tax=Paraburkholderia aspalathi TaxID=1324617 RepID=UPI001F475EB4